MGMQSWRPVGLWDIEFDVKLHSPFSGMPEGKKIDLCGDSQVSHCSFGCWRRGKFVTYALFQLGVIRRYQLSLEILNKQEIFPYIEWDARHLDWHVTVTDGHAGFLISIPLYQLYTWGYKMVNPRRVAVARNTKKAGPLPLKFHISERLHMVAISAGTTHSTALSEDGLVYYWFSADPHLRCRQVFFTIYWILLELLKYA